MGKIASNIAEVHPLIFTELIVDHSWFENMSITEILSLLSLFTDVNVSKDEKTYEPMCNNALVQNGACYLKERYEKYEDLEHANNIHSGCDFDDALTYDMPNLVEKWCCCNDEKECKFFLQNDAAIKGISAGDFTKALLKISTIARELSVVAEKMGNMECLHKLSECDKYILKYITTSQSLYV